MEDGELSLGDVFTRSPSPPPPEPTFATYDRPESLSQGSSWSSLSIRLVGSHPLWGHHLWNAARCFATYLDQNKESLCLGKAVLELGAGGGLPSLAAALCGARRVVLTDYPDRDLVENMEINVENNIPESIRHVTRVDGYIWGRPAADLLRNEDGSEEKFDVILMSDLIFNHSQHEALLITAELCLASSSSDQSSGTPCVLVLYTHHRPHLADRDMEFFSKARERGWTCEEIVTERYGPMFPEDSGDEAVRAVVHGWRLTRS
ncbi:hypothetical protein M422DRAFT_25671 [Sphaerobolus stellatus SS14]|nr:hypothetical protein M422DRAFT_25671 [Sphaerobolus stellatus SS14]